MGVVRDYLWVVSCWMRVAGTPWAVPLAGTVLLLEDVAEPPYRLDRLLTQLRQQPEALRELEQAAVVEEEASELGERALVSERALFRHQLFEYWQVRRENLLYQF